jgi:hypothetical protein
MIEKFIIANYIILGILGWIGGWYIGKYLARKRAKKDAFYGSIHNCGRMNKK